MLIFDADVPTPDRDSGSVRMRAIVEILVELGWSVTFVAHADDPQPGYDEQLTGLGVVVLHGADSARRHLRDAGGRYRCAWLSRPPLAEMYTAMVRAFALRASLVYDSVDLHWIRHLRAFELSTDPEDARLAEHFRKLEAFAVTSSDRVVAITDAEQRTIEEHWPRTHPVIVPNVHDVRLLPTPFRDRSGLLFVGNYRHPPNVDAMIWFVRDVLPLVRREIPEARLSIVGANVPDALRTLAGAGVDVPGWIQDVDPSFAEARVFVCPLRYGAGMKGKIGQAMSLGTPVVTTSVGAEGMRLASGVHALVEDDPVAFAAAVVRLYRDEALWSSVRCAAAAHVDQSFSRSAARRVIEDLLAPLSGPAAGPGARA